MCVEDVTPAIDLVKSQSSTACCDANDSMTNLIGRERIRWTRGRHPRAVFRSFVHEENIFGEERSWRRWSKGERQQDSEQKVSQLWNLQV